MPSLARGSNVSASRCAQRHALDLQVMPAARSCGAIAWSIAANPSHSGRVDRLAAAAHLSRHRFTEIFVGVMGSHARRIRPRCPARACQVAAHEDLDPDRGDRVHHGFRGHPHFCRAFRMATGVTPRQYRRQREPERPPALSLS
jgi:AraC-like DNA-binding protein